MELKDYYRALGVSSTSNLESIKIAYRKLSKKFHPDINQGDKFFEEKFKEIQEAYEVLSDENKRKQYDYKRRNTTKSGTAHSDNQENIFKQKEQDFKKWEDTLKQKEEALKKQEVKKSKIKLGYLVISICLIGLISFLFFYVINNNNKDIPDVSKIKVDIKLERFDKDFFAIDSNDVEPGLNKLYNKYPALTGIFLQNVLGLDSASTLQGVKNFISLSGKLYDTVNTVFRNTDDIEKDFKKGFQFVKYYFPKYKTPNIVTIAGPVDAMAQSDAGPTPNFLGPDFLGISLQFYLGKKFSVYSDPFFIDNVAPEYRSRRFSKEYIIADAMQLVVNDIFPGKIGGKPLIEQMVEKGKRWYLLDKFLPTTPDSVKTGYTQQQLNWCTENEGLIWGYIVKNEDLYSLAPSVIQTYIGEGPFTQGFSQELSPGNLGQWLGWQIVKKFVSKNPNIKPEEVMNTEAKKILDEAKYKPK